jgi:phenylacetate-CoA ligase
MTTITDTGVEALRARAGATLAGRLDEHSERVRWDAGQMEQFQRNELRRLLGHAVERSPFHARRLVGIDPQRFELEQLPELPVMTKEQMMSSLDELLTDPRLTGARVDGHLARAGDGARAAR